MNKFVKLFEDFDREEELDGLTLVKKLSTNDFMNMLKDGTIEKKNYIYRLVNYVPNTESLSWNISGNVAIPVKTDDTRAVSVKEKSMYKSPFIIFPKTIKVKECWFYEDEDGIITRYYGKSEKKKKAMTMKHVIVFSGISLTAFIGDRSVGATSTEVMKLSKLLDDVFDNEKRHESFANYARNYLGFNFDEVYVYEIEDTDDAAETIVAECEATVY